jgi:CRISPR-associated endonuclease/helicase Cas3
VTFEALFQKATGHPPYGYQRRLAKLSEWPETLEVPTGAGKTAAVFLAWLWRRRFASDALRAATPKRLVFCLPMRALTSQTERAFTAWLRSLGLDAPPAVHVVMGGAVDDAWLTSPDHDTVVLGTQDLLLSRALNRGFAMSRYTWPMAFGLLNNDVQWVFDEVQLMGVGATTSAQLAGLRRSLLTFGQARSLWMSATLETGRLTTIDHPTPGATFTLTGTERAELAHLLDAPKSMSPLVVDGTDCRAVAKACAAMHAAGTKTLLVVNTVKRAQELHREMQKAAPGVETALLHSRFRPADREAREARVLARDWSGIIVATQVIEAGIDCSARTLITDLAPWASIVQRCGRCNRYGTETGAAVYWIDRTAKEATPYAEAEMLTARDSLGTLRSASPSALATVRAPEARVALPVIRRRDLIDLFDTTQDLSGADIDVSPFIRDTDDADVFVAWRDLSAINSAEPRAAEGTDAGGRSSSRRTLPPALRLPAREEICRVPIGAARELLKQVRGSNHRALRWDHRDSAWEPVEQATPGQVWLVEHDAGGYAPETGFDAKLRSTVPIVMLTDAGPEPEGDTDDPRGAGSNAETLEAHTARVAAAVAAIVAASAVPHGLLYDQLITAAHWHDVGKAHPVFQQTMYGEPADGRPLLAKSARAGRHVRKAFRHEIASALAVLGAMPEAFLIAYLVASHHGKARLIVRARPGEPSPRDGRTVMLGLIDGEQLPAVELPSGTTSPALTLDLRVFALGGDGSSASWTARSVALRDTWGPFRLAYLETLLRCGDWRASSTDATP